jgi:hypothetical protein
MEDSSAARELLAAAELQLESCGLTLWLAVVRLRLAEMQPPERAEALRRKAINWRESQKVREPECIVKMLLPRV